MKIELEERIIESNITNKAYEMQIDNDSHIIYESLRKNLYPDPIKAISREITANALDAHIENGNPDIPVEIFFPEGYLVIKDRGVGISPDRMEQVFCWYGRSTKRDDNTQIGGWGIGAKSVWSYADSFVVDTVYNGIKYTYTAFIDESLKGKMLLMHSDESDEPNGTSIKIPIKREDRFLFRNALRNHTRFWKVPPVFHGEISEPPFKPTLNGDKWSIYLKDTGNYNVLCGGIPYQDYMHSIPAKVVLNFDVGELDLTLNRDTLRYTEKTTNAIKNRLKDFNDEIVEQIQTQLDTVNTFGEVITLIQSIPSNKTSNKWTWKGKDFCYPFVNSVECYERPRQKLSCFRTRRVDGDVNDQSFIEVDKDEITSYDKQRIGSYLNNNKVSKVYLIKPDENDLPIKATKLSSIRVIRTKNNVVKVTKTTIKGREWRSRRQANYLINSPHRIVYTTDPIETFKSVYSLGVTLIEISEKDVKHIDDEINWISLEDYLKENLFDKLSLDQIKSIANQHAGVGRYTNFSFLADHHPDFAFLKKDDLDTFLKNQNIDTKDSNVIMNLVDFLIENNRITPDVPDLYKKYEMFQLLGYFYHDKHDFIKNYVDLVNKKQENENVN